MSVSPDFDGVIARFKAKEPSAYEEIFSRYVRRLTALASSQFDSGIRFRADPEGVVQSVYRSFFSRDASQYRLADWEAIWRLLAVITVRKCWKRRARYRKEHLVPLPRWDEDDDSANARQWAKLVDHTPTPAEAVALTETVSQLFGQLEADDLKMAEFILQGYTAVEIAERFDCCEKTVRRLRDHLRSRLRDMTAEDSRG
jgi:RNA polymerase sigma-70 factor, ECF subfamily